MKGSEKSRRSVLSRIQSATQGSGADSLQIAASYDALPRTYFRQSKLGNDMLCERILERLREYDAKVVECAPGELPSAIADQLLASGKRTFITPRGVPTEWMGSGFNWKVDNHLTTDEVEQVDGALNGATCGIAESGTIVLHHSEMEGRRLISLLPDWHFCVLYASQLVETLPEYFARCDVPPGLATYISGPSATADIEMTRIKGVHGPRFLVVMLVRDV